MSRTEKDADRKERVRLMTENGDCKHCCGDHQSKDCNKSDRECGGGKDNRGCTRGHKLHELFCVEAKVFAVSIQSMSANGDSNTVVLLIMTIQTFKKSICATTFFDSLTRDVTCALYANRSLENVVFEARK